MPRTTERAQVLHEIDIAIEDTACACVLASSSDLGEENNHWEDLEELVDMQDHISSHRYLNGVYMSINLVLLLTGVYLELYYGKGGTP